MNNILIGGAWPYANGSLHIGHIAALLPGDVLARYFRAKGERVFYVSGSDCHGTPITVRAKEEGLTAEEISEKYHKEFCAVFDALGFSYDRYTKTSDEKHKAFVREFHTQIYESEYVEERTVKQAYCPSCQKALTDRLVVGVCPSCKAPTRGDQCDACGEVLEVDTILNARCAQCGEPLVFRDTTQLYLLISKLKDELTAFLESHPHWRKNAIAFTRRYINEGLRDRAITRDLDWGIDVPKKGYENKKIYIWAENVLGYLSATAALCKERGIPFHDVYGQNSRHYYIHGKDNIPFHSIILPALLLAHGKGLRLPDEIVSSEYMTLEGRKISTSHHHAVWATELIERFHPDAIRYFFLVNGPEKRDTDFSYREFREQNNAELVGAWGNFVNRTLAFIQKYEQGLFPKTPVNHEIIERVENAFSSVGGSIEKGHFKDGLEGLFELVRFGNKYYDSEQPWKTRTEHPERCAQTLSDCVYLIGNLAVLLHPFLPFSSKRILEWLGLRAEWKPQAIQADRLTDDYGILFSRIE